MEKLYRQHLKYRKGLNFILHGSNQPTQHDPDLTLLSILDTL